MVRPFRPLTEDGYELLPHLRVRRPPALTETGEPFWYVATMYLVFGHGQRAGEVLEMDDDQLEALWGMRERFAEILAAEE